MSWFAYRPYVPVSQRRAAAAKLTTKLRKDGRPVSPVEVTGRAIATTFWGKAWCDHLESYSDYANRLPRGRTYVRNGSVIDLQIAPGKVTALVSGSEVYKIAVDIKELPAARWKAVRERCAGQIGSVLELLKGRFDKSVMAVLCDRDNGLFPAPAEISMECSCPDWADMCKHLAAVLYGVGSRLDSQPELLFVLRKVDHMELLDPVAAAGSLGAAADDGRKTLAADDLADVFGIDLDQSPAPAAESGKPAAKRATAGKKAAAAKAPGTRSPAVAKPAKKGGTKAVPKTRAKKSAAPAHSTVAAEGRKGTGQSKKKPRTRKPLPR